MSDRRGFDYAINLAETVEGAEHQWIIYVDRPGAYEVGPALCSRPGCYHKVDHHSHSKLQCLQCKCIAISLPNTGNTHK